MATNATNENLKWALTAYGDDCHQAAALYTKYYDGNHPIAFASEKWRNAFGVIFKKFAENLCPAVVDSLCERLKVTGWESSEGTTKIEEVEGTTPSLPSSSPLQGAQLTGPYQKVTPDDPWGEQALELWNANEMGSRSLEVHTEAVKAGDGYLLIWPGLDMEAEFWPQTALEMAIEYDPNKLGVISRGAKLWWLPVEKKWRLNLYLPDRIEKYITAQSMPNGVPQDASAWDSTSGDNGGGSTVPNPYGRVPIFHFSNRLKFKPGVSDLKDIVPVQDALNKSVLDMLVAMEFASFKQRWIIGMEVEIDEVTGEPVNENVKNFGVDRLMAIPGDKDEISVGQFEATDLTQFIQVSDKFKMSAAQISGTPLHYFFITSGDFPSGEAIKSAESRFVGRIESRQEDWTPRWGDAMEFALGLDQGVPEGLELTPLWKDASPRSDSELADTAVKKKAVGVSRSQLLREMGYSEEEIVRMLQEADAYSVQQAQLQAKPDTQSQNGAGGGTPAATQGATDARSQGRVGGVKS